MKQMGDVIVTAKQQFDRYPPVMVKGEFSKKLKFKLLNFYKKLSAEVDVDYIQIKKMFNDINEEFIVDSNDNDEFFWLNFNTKII